MKNSKLTSLHTAVLSGNLGAVRSLLDQGAGENCAAAGLISNILGINMNPEIINLLLDTIPADSPEMLNYLKLALSSDNTDALEYILVNRGLDKKLYPNNKTLLQIAVQKGDVALTKMLLLRHKADINYFMNKDKDGFMASSMAYSLNNSKIVPLLMKAEISFLKERTLEDYIVN